MILPIYTLGQPVLRKVAEDIDPADPELAEFVQNMYETLDLPAAQRDRCQS